MAEYTRECCSRSRRNLPCKRHQLLIVRTNSGARPVGIDLDQHRKDCLKAHASGLDIRRPLGAVTNDGHSASRPLQSREARELGADCADRVEDVATTVPREILGLGNRLYGDAAELAFEGQLHDLGGLCRFHVWSQPHAEAAQPLRHALKVRLEPFAVKQQRRRSQIAYLRGEASLHSRAMRRGRRGVIRIIGRPDIGQNLATAPA